jgi:hypothetical protein
MGTAGVQSAMHSAAVKVEKAFDFKKISGAWVKGPAG